MEMSSGEAELREIRKKIDEIDDAIADLLSKRMQYAHQAKDVKQQMNKPLADMHCEKEVIEKWRERARRSGDYGLSEEMMSTIAAFVTRYTLKKEEQE
ncbi:MAG: chorismate mutase [Methanosarcinales archaeon]